MSQDYPASIVDQLRAMRRPLTTKQVAELLGLHPITVYKWAGAGRIPVLRIGSVLRYDPSVLASWVTDRTL